MRKKTIVIFLFCLCLIALLGGCRSKKENDRQQQKGTAVYYTNEQCSALVSVKKKVKLGKNAQKNVDLLLSQMQKNRKDSKYRSAIPKRIIINSAKVNLNIVSVDFSVGYKKLNENEDLICRAGIVYTLTQLKGIDYVSFSIAGTPMFDTDGKVLGALGRDSFVFGNLPMK
ncbi:GerMN domain-containing protein [Anaerostipes sp. MSJ-23]|uniref:GerMN domain-containing protein n=1 Tax=unclassified Anaerostipes TaxID=2635253 RepID=UPI001C103DB4|nr:GerMN domain-containing protein [Anaerostipes sp. MSJ-23]MBU5460078.1 GerMN domain-containing protein [Anaerostipes sp. MSJ-23]